MINRHSTLFLSHITASKFLQGSLDFYCFYKTNYDFKGGFNPMFYNTEAKQSLVARYHAGESVARDLRRHRRTKKYILHMDQAIYGNRDKLRSCGQPAGVYQTETETPEVRGKDRDIAEGQLHSLIATSGKAARARQTVWTAQRPCFSEVSAYPVGPFTTISSGGKR